MHFSTIQLVHPVQPDEATTIDTLVANGALRAVFQPIVRLGDGEIAGYEGLIRGPVGTPFEMPRELFAQASREDRSSTLEIAAAQMCCETFARLNGAGLLFINASAAVIEASLRGSEGIGTLLGASLLPPARVVVELTERSVGADVE